MKSKTFSGFLAATLAVAVSAAALLSVSSCGVYSFSEKGSIPDSVKTIKLNFITNTAAYQNPQVSPSLTDRLRQKIVNQTKLTVTNRDDAHWEIDAQVQDYSVSPTAATTTGTGQTQTSINRLTVRVHVTVNKRIDNKVEEFDVSRSLDFSASQSLQTAEASFLDELIRNLTDEIFNSLFANW